MKKRLLDYCAAMKKLLMLLACLSVSNASQAKEVKPLTSLTVEQVSRVFELVAAHENLEYSKACNLTDGYTCISNLGKLRVSSTAPTETASIGNVAIGADPQQFELAAKLASDIILGSIDKTKLSTKDNPAELGSKVFDALNSAFVTGLSAFEFGDVFVSFVHQPDKSGVLVEILHST